MPESENVATAHADKDERLRQIGELMRNAADGLDPEAGRSALRLRHLAGIEMLADANGDPGFVEPAHDALPSGVDLIEVGPDDLTPGLLRAAILGHGCLLVRGLLDRAEALELAAQIDHSFSSRTGGGEAGYYEEFEPEAPHRVSEREWIEMGGGVLAVDAPGVTLNLFKALERAGFPELVRDYLGEEPLISAQKTTLRKAEPSVRGAWHQDGKFLGDIKALNLWLSLSRCGDESPGLDLVPARIEHLVDAGTDSPFPIEISRELVEEAAGGKDVMRPIFEPGDALLFDELFLHQTGSDPEMPKPRYAVESWFFGASAFPADYAPLAARGS